MLDPSKARFYADEIESMVDLEEPEEVIPALILLISRLAKRTVNMRETMEEVEELLGQIRR